MDTPGIFVPINLRQLAASIVESSDDLDILEFIREINDEVADCIFTASLKEMVNGLEG